jgi:hypothetical protein
VLGQHHDRSGLGPHLRLQQHQHDRLHVPDNLPEHDGAELGALRDHHDEQRREQQISSTARLSTGAWHHIAVVLDAGATYTGTLYIDGAVAGTNAAMTIRPSNIGNTPNNWIGRSAFVADPYFAGLIDDFRIYNRALTAPRSAISFQRFAEALSKRR